MNARELSNVTITFENNIRRVVYKVTERDYTKGFTIMNSPTDNCQLSCAASIGPISDLSRDHLRHLLIEIRKSHASRRILLMDVRERHALGIIRNLAAGSIISNTAYKSTNGSRMNIILVKLSSIRQLKGAKTVSVIATK